MINVYQVHLLAAFKYHFFLVVKRVKSSNLKVREVNIYVVIVKQNMSERLTSMLSL